MSKLYTKTGDKGKTSLLGGKKVSKSDDRIEAYGSIDELNAHLGFLKDQEPVDERIKQQLYWIQEHLFSIGSILATEPGFSGFVLPIVNELQITQLEKWIDQYTDKLPELKNFILPGGHNAVSICHICRTICRRSERNVVRLAENEPLDENIVVFLNRLSDYLFILARKISHDLNAPEIPWVPSN